MTLSFAAGVVAAKAGVPLDDNPFDPKFNPFEFSQWSEGWRKAVSDGCNV